MCLTPPSVLGKRARVCFRPDRTYSEFFGHPASAVACNRNPTRFAKCRSRRRSAIAVKQCRRRTRSNDPILVNPGAPRLVRNNGGANSRRESDNVSFGFPIFKERFW